MPKLRRIDLEDREGIRRELLRFVEELKEKLPVSRVYLFGSFARGKVHEGSDIDLLIVADDSLGPSHRLTRRLAEEAFGPPFLSCGELFSALVYTRSRFDGLESALPLFEQIEREGILLHGRDPFDRTAG